MHGWRTTYNRATRGLVHRITGDFGHALLSPVVARTFGILRISASVWERGNNWLPLHVEHTLLAFELRYSGVPDRYAYNERMRREIERRRKTVIGAFAGYSDVFSPILVRGKMVGALVVGPFATARPTNTEILERWQRLTERAGHPADPEFSPYLSAVLSVLVLDGPRAEKLAALVDCLAQLMAQSGDPAKLTNRAEKLRAEIEMARAPERMWDVVREIIDDPSQRRSYELGLANDLRDLGLEHGVDHVLVGLAVSTANSEPVDEVLRHDAFQRRAVGLAQEAGETVVGQVGRHGVVFLCGAQGAAGRQKQRLVQFSDRVAAHAKSEFALSLWWGLAPVAEGASLASAYQAALGAAELALTRQGKLEVAAASQAPPGNPLSRLRKELRNNVLERPASFGAGFDRYLEAVAVQSAHRVELCRTHAEVALELVVEELIRKGALDERSFRALSEDLARDAGKALTTRDLFAVYRRVVLDLVEAMKRPVVMRQHRGIRHAIDFIHGHYSEPISLARVAKAAGFARSYFSGLFKREQGVTFEHYLKHLRIERAKQLLADTDLEVFKVAELAGFANGQYFARVFRQATGTTPVAYRGQVRPIGARRPRARAAGRSRT